jgi:hypothetical protein
MTRFWRTLAAATAVSMIAAGTATAQTVLVRHATPGETVDVVVNSAAAVSDVVGPDGVARVGFALPAEWLRSGMDARIFADSCVNRRRVLIIERNAPVPAAAEGCTRSDIAGLYLVRRESTLVVNVAGTIPTLLLVKGNFSLKPPTPAPSSSKGLVLYGGGGFASFPDEVDHACGNVSDCGGDDTVGMFTGGASFWVTKWLALDGSYVKPSKPTAAGGDELDGFDSTIDVEFLTAGGKLAVPVGRMRIYVTGGATFHRATTTVVQTIAGASQTIPVETEGVGWYAGGGFEVWATKWFGLYAEGSRSVLKGDRTDKAEGSFNEAMNVAVLGARVRIF